MRDAVARVIGTASSYRTYRLQVLDSSTMTRHVSALVDAHDSANSTRTQLIDILKIPNYEASILPDQHNAKFNICTDSFKLFTQNTNGNKSLVIYPNHPILPLFLAERLHCKAWSRIIFEYWWGGTSLWREESTDTNNTVTNTTNTGPTIKEMIEEVLKDHETPSSIMVCKVLQLSQRPVKI